MADGTSGHVDERQIFPMAKESTTAMTAAGESVSQRFAPPSAAERTRLSQCYKTGDDNLKRGNLDYAIEMFSLAVVGDPSSQPYLRSLLEALKQKHAGKKPGGLSALFSAGSRGSMKKLAAGGQVRDAIKSGVAMLRQNPADIGCLLSLSECCGLVGCLDTQGTYLRAALDVAPLDPEVNRQCAAYMEKLGQFDQAIACWNRISGVRGVKDEAQREIARLSVEKTTRTLDKSGGRTAGNQVDTGDNRLETLRKRLAATPTDTEVALELADLLELEGAGVEEAEQVLRAALAASGNDLKMREHLEDRQLRWAKKRVLMAEKVLASDDTDEAKERLSRLRKELLKQEIQIYAARADRYPENTNWRYELALRLKAAGSFAEAIKHFQEVLGDSRRKGVVALELGECFQKIKQFSLAMRNYQTAVDSLTDRELDLRKRALYRAGVLAQGLSDPDTAQKYLGNLAELDFGYRDVAERLAKLGPQGG